MLEALELYGNGVLVLIDVHSQTNVYQRIKVVEVRNIFKGIIGNVESGISLVN